MPNKPDNLKLLEQLTDGFNSHDLESIMNLFAEDCSLDMPRGPEPWGGVVYFNGEDVNLQMVRAGMAWHYKAYQKEQGERQRRQYSKAESRAILVPPRPLASSYSEEVPEKVCHRH